MISIHAPLRERPIQKGDFKVPPINFNPRSLAGATQIAITLRRSALISIHAPSRERPVYTRVNKAKEVFQSTLPYGSDPMVTLFIVALFVKFQSTLPHGSDPCGQCLGCRLDISIHAPSRERLLCFGWFPSDVRISIHAPSRERLARLNQNIISRLFQSTLPHGSDQKLCNGLFVDGCISIHAPSRERHQTIILRVNSAGISIHAPSRERLLGNFLVLFAL